MRWTRQQGTILVAAGAALLAAGVWWGLVAGSDEGARGEGGTPDAVDVQDELDLIPGCTISSCQVLARRGGFRFDGTPATLVVVGRPQACQGLAASSLHLVAPDAVLWSSPADLVCGDPVAGIETDRTGKAFLVFEAVAEGSAEGAQALVLWFEGGEVDDFGSFDGRYRGGQVRTRDVDGDGVFEVLVDDQQFHWDGNGYRPA